MVELELVAEYINVECPSRSSVGLAKDQKFFGRRPEKTRSLAKDQMFFGRRSVCALGSPLTTNLSRLH